MSDYTQNMQLLQNITVYSVVPRPLLRPKPTVPFVTSRAREQIRRRAATAGCCKKAACSYRALFSLSHPPIAVACIKRKLIGRYWTWTRMSRSWSKWDRNRPEWDRNGVEWTGMSWNGPKRDQNNGSEWNRQGWDGMRLNETRMDMIGIEPNETRICSKCSFNTCMLNITKGFKKQFCVCVFLNSLYRLRGIKSLCENVVWHQNLQQRVLLVRVFITFSTFSFCFSK